MAQTSNEIKVLTRDVSCTAIPSGQDVTLFKGTEVRITQSLGGTFTVVTHQGAMASIQGKDADALGKEIPADAREDALAPGGVPDAKFVEERVWAKLKTCYDPEIPHNIVDLGLVYECKITPLAAPEHRVDVKMTLTAPGCGMGDYLRRDAEKKILTIPGVKECAVEVVFDPPWNPNKMNPALRRELFF
ncbi:MAG TPA: putative Fe-S cluster assembly protein SufT [Verrucomicrobiae bacterium]|nr:putative Fe-S cluster assembly protein SufT [Verrucomicrobiae bacterium]